MSRKRSINSVPKSMNGTARVSIYVRMCMAHACMLRFTCSGFLPLCSCSNTHRTATAEQCMGLGSQKFAFPWDPEEDALCQGSDIFVVGSDDLILCDLGGGDL